MELVIFDAHSSHLIIFNFSADAAYKTTWGAHGVTTTQGESFHSPSFSYDISTTSHRGSKARFIKTIEKVSLALLDLKAKLRTKKER